VIIASFCAFLLFAGQGAADVLVPTNLVAEGIPPIPDALKSNVAPYLALGGASFRGWHPLRREMLVTTRVGGLTQLHRLAEPRGKRIPLTRWTEPVNYGWYQPVSGELLVFQADKGGNEQYQFYALAAGRTNRPVTLLTDGRSRNTSPRWSRDGQWLAYASTRRNGKDNDVFVVNPLDPTATRCVATNSSSSWSVADWSADNTKLLLRHGFSDERSELWCLDLSTGERQQLTPKGKKLYVSQPRWGDQDRAVYALSDHNSDFLAITRLDLHTDQWESLTPHIGWDVEDFDISHDGKTLAFVTNEDGFSRLHLLDLATRNERPVPQIPGGIISGLAWHPKFPEIGFTLESSQSPSDAYSLDINTGVLTRWTDRLRRSSLPQTFAEPELWKLKSFDGLTFSTFLYRPDPKKFPGPRPVLIIIHGGPTGQSRPGFRGSANFYLNELGVALAYPNVRGSSGYGRKFLALDNGFRREDAVKDIGTLLEWLRRQPTFDCARIAVMGTSYGGYMTLACLAKYNDLLRCGVDNVGIADFVTFLRDTADYRRASRRSEYGDERDPQMREFLKRISPATNAHQIRAPLLIVQGKNDPRVPVTEAERIRDAIRSHHGTVWYLMATDEGHGFVRKTNVDFQFLATILFFQEHLLK